MLALSLVVAAGLTDFVRYEYAARPATTFARSVDKRSCDRRDFGRLTRKSFRDNEGDWSKVGPRARSGPVITLSKIKSCKLLVKAFIPSRPPRLISGDGAEVAIPYIGSSTNLPLTRRPISTGVFSWSKNEISLGDLSNKNGIPVINFEVSESKAWCFFIRMQQIVIDEGCVQRGAPEAVYKGSIYSISAVTGIDGAFVEFGIIGKSKDDTLTFSSISFDVSRR